MHLGTTVGACFVLIPTLLLAVLLCSMARNRIVMYTALLVMCQCS